MRKTLYISLPGPGPGRGEGDGEGETATTRTAASSSGGHSSKYHAVVVRDRHDDLDDLNCLDGSQTVTVGDVLASLGIPSNQNQRASSNVGGSFHLLGSRCQRRWRPSATLVDVLADAPHESFFAVVPALCGGGADGGSTGNEDRKAFLEMYAGNKPDAVDPKELRLAKYTTCQLSQEPLSKPIICDELGQLYNKEAFLNALLSKTIPKALGHLSRKSVFDVELSELGGAASDGITFGRPITALPLNGKVRFVVVRDAGRNGKGSKNGKGWVVSKKAVDELKEVVREVTGGFTDVLPLYPEGDEFEAAMKKVAERMSDSKAAKKSAVGKKRAADAVGPKTGGSEDDKKRKAATTVVVAAAPDGSAAYRSIFLDKSKTSNPSNDFMVRGKGR